MWNFGGTYPVKVLRPCSRRGRRIWAWRRRVGCDGASAPCNPCRSRGCAILRRFFEVRWRFSCCRVGQLQTLLGALDGLVCRSIVHCDFSGCVCYCGPVDHHHACGDLRGTGAQP